MAIHAGQRVGPYEILAVIGAGGMGEVYRARDIRLSRDVALKILPEIFAADPDRMARFEREARVLAALSHPHIAAIHGLEESGVTCALVMELLEGPTLADRIAAGPIPLDEALPIAKQIAEALEYAHDHGVIHRDLKPSNIKVSTDGSVKVLDFGLAKALQDEPIAADPRDSPTLSMAATMPGVILGTAAYMSPEQAKGRPVDRRADIWAFGVVLFEMLTGKTLYSGETAAEIVAAVMMKEPTLDALPVKIPPAIRNLLRRCLEKNLKRRLQHIGEARIVIEDVLSGTTPTEPPVVQRRWPIGWVALTAVLLFAVVALSFMRLHNSPGHEQSIRFQVPPPEKSTPGMFRLSPDARYIVTVTYEGGRTALWLQPLDSLQPQALPGTEGATYPFWSPDSAFIGFFAQGKLKKIAVAGGPPQTLCDAPNGRGGTWNNSGLILFTPDVTGGLYRVSAAGGLAAPVTQPTPSNGAVSDRFPEFLPGGNRFLYLQLDDKLEKPEISVGSLAGNPPVRILSDYSNAVYVPPAAAGRSGYLLFRRGTTLMAQPFNPDRLQLTSEMFPVAEEVGERGNQGNAAFSASDNGVLAYSSGGNLGILSREMAWVDRTGKRLGIAGQPGPISNPALSPDEKRISFGAAQKQGNRFDLWLLDVARGVPSRFTFRSDGADDGIWSPDGSTIVFGSNATSIYRKPANGAGKEELLLAGGTNDRPSDWSRDGKFVVYESFGGATGTDLWLLPMEGDHKPLPYLQTPFNEGNAQFSPDGRWMAYSSNESGQAQVYVQAIPASGAKWQISPAGGDQPRWRRDGKELFYISADQKLMAVPVKSGAAFEASAPRSLFALDPVYPPITGRFAYQPGADGNRFLILANVGGAGAPITVVLNWQAGLKK